MQQILNKTYDPSSFETEVYNRSEKEFELQNSNNVYSIMMPPPNITGNLHVGHALTYTLQDILVRFYRQSGYNVLWQPGTDHAGIATQMVVERKLEQEGQTTLTRDEFIEQVWKWKQQSGDIIVKQQRRLGCSACWTRSRFTMDEGMSKAVAHAFVQLFKAGLIYRDKRLVNWDYKFKTAISDLEIVNKEEKGTLWYIKYQIADNDKYITIATTRPETMFGDVAIAVNPNDDRYKSMHGMFAIIPFTDRKIPIICDEHADMGKGTGAVKITPAHDYNDFIVGKRNNLPMINIFDENIHLLKNEYVPEFLAGIFAKKARKIIVEKLKENNLLVKEEEIMHSVPYGDRSNVVIEPFLTDQWFVDAPQLAKEALSAVEQKKTCFIPEKWVNTYYEWMKNIQPWCISRQIIWGHQIPAWFGPNGEIIVEETEEKAFKQADKLGIQHTKLIRDKDVLDTWFSSGLWPIATLGWPEKTEELEKFYPTTVLITGFDIIFFWVARMMMMCMYFTGKVPFADVYIHALVRDEKGQKMSKSKGNVLDPLVLMDKYGADALRFTLSFFSVPGCDLKICEDNVKISRNFITKIWNAARFLQYNNFIFSKNIEEINPKSLLCKWLLGKAQMLQQQINDDVKNYRFDYIAKDIQVFLREIFCDFFIECSKIADTTEVKQIASYVFFEFLRISHPVIPFVTDYLVHELYESDTLTTKDSHKLMSIKINYDEIKIVDNFVNTVHKIRSNDITNYEEELKQFPDELQALHKICTIR